ncbi:MULTISPECIES: hypothetical protein [Fusobacterium]|uniref:hypothetical protein n=1 Tax=Fusobacterium TaxID=848 RepID=UPI0008A32523|nr:MULTISPECIES: hypothetical protein [Fusobacterium]MCF2674635.1 hypothetical protein [Fusobacterium varium]OFL84129.1 hypothetical protein HMPREF2747_11655 [Fusobacterium sp. HMSC073F01]
MLKYKNYFKFFFLFWIIVTTFIGSQHYWKVNGRYHKPEWYQDYEILELDGKKYAVISYDKKSNKFLIVEATIQDNELILNMKKRIFSDLVNIPISNKKFEVVKVVK